MVHLVNSAVMPQEGKYTLIEISRFDFIAEVKQAFQEKTLISYIAYSQNIELIKQWTGVKLIPNRSKTALEKGDVLLCMTLKYRSEGYKGKLVDENDFQFFR